MAFEGDLKDLELGDVLQTLSMTRQFGTLVIRGAEERRIAFSERGLALLSSRPSLADRVGRLLVGRSHVAPEDLDAARTLSRRRRGAAVDEILLEEGAVEPEALRSARRYVAQEEIFELFRWREGAFTFQADEAEYEGPFSDVWFDIAGIAMEAARRIDEFPGVNAAVPLGEVFAPAESDAAPVRGRASDDLVALFRLIDGTRTTEDLIDAFHLGSFDTRKFMVQLVESGAIRPAGVDEILAAASAVSDSKTKVRLLRRAVERAPSDADAWSRLGSTLASAGRKREAANALAELARLQHRAGEGDVALDTLDTARRLDRSNPVVHSHRTRVLFAIGRVDDALVAARDAVAQCLAADDPRAALDLGEEALTFEPSDVVLRRGCAAALAALGRKDEAIHVLEQLAEGLAGDERVSNELVDIYRALASLADDGSAWEERLDELRASANARRKRRMHVLAVAAGALILLVAAIPLLAGPSPQAQIDEARDLVAQGLFPEADEIVNGLSGASLSEDEEIALRNLVAAMERGRTPDAVLPLRRAIFARLEGVYDAAGQAVAERRFRDAFDALRLAVGELDGDDARRLATMAPDVVKEFRREVSKEARAQLTAIETQCLALSSRASDAASQLRESEALKRAELTVEADDVRQLETLTQLAEEILAGEAALNLDALETDLAWLSGDAKLVPAELTGRLLAQIGALRSECEFVRTSGNHALAFVHKADLLTKFKAANSTASDRSRDGRLQDAADELQDYVEFCSRVRGHDRGDEYDRIVCDYLDSLPLENMIRQRLDAIRGILDQERRAADALEAGDVAQAFALRCELVRANPAVAFRQRFELPISVTSQPPGATVTISTLAGEREAGTTPLTLRYPVSGVTEIRVTRPGFKTEVIRRGGAIEDSTAELHVRLVKESLWVSEAGARTEAAVGIGDGVVYVAGRDGIVRSLDLADGSEIARCDTGQLGGFVAPPTVHGDGVHVVGVDGLGFVLDSRTLEERHRYTVDGAVRAAPLSIAAGVVVADDRGTVRLITDTGSTAWAQQVGTVLVDPIATPAGLVLVTLDGELVTLSPTDGTERGRIRLPGEPRWSAPVLHDGRIYVASESGVLSAVDARSSKLVWQRDLEVPIVGRPALIDATIAVASMRGRVVLASLTTDEVRIEDTDGPIEDGIVSIRGACIAATAARGSIRCLKPDGSMAWRYDAHEAITARPVLVGDRLLVVTRAGRVIAIAP